MQSDPMIEDCSDAEPESISYSDSDSESESSPDSIPYLRSEDREDVAGMEEKCSPTGASTPKIWAAFFEDALDLIELLEPVFSKGKVCIGSLGAAAANCSEAERSIGATFLPNLKDVENFILLCTCGSGVCRSELALRK